MSVSDKLGNGGKTSIIGNSEDNSAGFLSLELEESLFSGDVLFFVQEVLTSCLEYWQLTTFPHFLSIQRKNISSMNLFYISAKRPPI